MHRMTQAWGWCATLTAAAILVLTQIRGGNPFEAFGITMGMTVALFLVLTGITRIAARRRKKKQARMSDPADRTEP